MNRQQLYRRSLKISVPMLLAAGAIAGGYGYWQYQQRFPSTDDAYIRANIVNIAPRVDGKVIALHVHDHTRVAAGQLLFDLDPAPYQLAVRKAQAELEATQEELAAADMAVKSAQAALTQRQAELKDTQAQTQRLLALVKKKFVAQAEGDVAIRNWRVAQAAVIAAHSQLQEAIRKRGQLGTGNAHLRIAQASLAQAQLNLQYTHVQAPAAGYIANCNLRQGQTVTAYQPLFALIENRALWTEANFKETQLSRIKPGQPATIKIDMYPRRTFQGVVSNISEDSGSSFSLFPPENASGNWVKVTQRFPVKITMLKPDARYPLRLGASCTATIYTTH